MAPNGKEGPVWSAQRLRQGHFFRNEQISYEKIYKAL